MEWAANLAQSALSQVGLMVHCFDGTEDWAQPWAPCLEGECVQGHEKKNFVRWWSVSIINQEIGRAHV